MSDELRLADEKDKRDNMTVPRNVVMPIINKIYVQDLQHFYTNKYVGNVRLFGWIFVDGLVVYMEDQPKYHPLTGEKFDTD